ncbi:MAG: PEP-CTERM sorting domain-containing protein [Sedimentisphaerales bacterium]|nr:PEP-CTERM sorting domain-containing protein [Sedimentisphaerales bacterium]
MGNRRGQRRRYYTDLYYDDNDPILFATPEPATIALLLLGAGFIRRKRR